MQDNYIHILNYCIVLYLLITNMLLTVHQDYFIRYYEQ